MADSGYVDKAVVIDVLKRHGVEVSCDDGGPGGPGMYIFVRGEKVDCRRLLPNVHRRVLQRFKRLFGVPIHHFYHPYMAPMRPEESIQ